MSDNKYLNNGDIGRLKSDIDGDVIDEEWEIHTTLASTNSYNFLSQIMDFCSAFLLFGCGSFRTFWCVCGFLTGLGDLGWGTLDVLFL